MNPQGYGSSQFNGNPNINYGQTGPMMNPAGQNEEMSLNVINAVNANGIVTGDKVVSYIWKRVGICAMIIAGATLVGIAICVLIMNGIGQEKNKVDLARQELENDLQAIYASLGVEKQENAITQINDVETLNGGDISEINALLSEHYGTDYVTDVADQNINFVRKSGAYKIVSLGIRRDSGSVRAILYERIADGVWVMSSFDSKNIEDPCANSSKEEKVALKGLDVCEEKAEK